VVDQDIISEDALLERLTEIIIELLPSLRTYALAHPNGISYAAPLLFRRALTQAIHEDRALQEAADGNRAERDLFFQGKMDVKVILWYKKQLFWSNYPTDKPEIGGDVVANVDNAITLIINYLDEKLDNVTAPELSHSELLRRIMGQQGNKYRNLSDSTTILVDFMHDGAEWKMQMILARVVRKTLVLDDPTPNKFDDGFGQGRRSKKTK